MKNQKKEKGKFLNKGNKVDPKTRIINENTVFHVKEVYKSIRTKLMFSMPKTEDGKVISVSSSMSHEGKTTTIINMALTFAQTNLKVILLDCDLRKSHVHRYLDIEMGKGVSDILCGLTTIDGAIQKNVRDNLDVITAGETPPNPAELFDSEEFPKLIDNLKKRYDYIFIDVPPITVVTDAQLILKKCNGTVLIVRKDFTSYDMLDAAVDNIKKSDGKILGMIMLGSDNHTAGKKYYYYKYYGYYDKK